MNGTRRRRTVYMASFNRIVARFHGNFNETILVRFFPFGLTAIGKVILWQGAHAGISSRVSSQFNLQCDSNCRFGFGSAGHILFVIATGRKQARTKQSGKACAQRFMQNKLTHLHPQP